MDDHRIEAMLAEYNALRTEVVAAIGHRIQIVNLTFAAMSVLIAGLLTRKVSDVLTGLVALFVLPQFAKASMLIWLGEYGRSQRASRWLGGLEQRINAELGGFKAMGWDGRPSQAHMGYPYVATVTLVLGIGYLATVVGAYFLFDDVSKLLGHPGDAVVVAAFVVYAVVVEVSFGLFFRSRWRALRLPALPAPDTAPAAAVAASGEGAAPSTPEAGVEGGP